MADELTVTGWCAQQEEAFTYVSVDLGSVRRVKAIMVKGVVTNDVVSRPTEIRVFFSNKIRSNQEFRRLLPQFQPDVPRSGQLRRAGHDHPTSVRPSASRNSTICADRRWAWSLTCPSRLPAPSCRLCWTWPPPTFRAASTARLESRPSVEPRTAVDECVLPVCGFGTYSPTGLVPCLQCPRNSFTGTPPPGRLPANGNHWTSLPDVTWYLNGHQMLDDATHKILANESGNHALMITGAGLSDSGVIQCVARNKGGEASFQVRLRGSKWWTRNSSNGSRRSTSRKASPSVSTPIPKLIPASQRRCASKNRLKSSSQRRNASRKSFICATSSAPVRSAAPRREEEERIYEAPVFTLPLKGFLSFLNFLVNLLKN